MALMFVRKHGIRFDPSALSCLAVNLYVYPVQVFQEWALVRFVPLLLPLSLLFAVALDDFLESQSVGPAWLSEPLPIWAMVSAHFFVGTCQRLRIHVAHMKRKDHVREVLIQSVWKKHLGNLSIGWHIHHALVLVVALGML